ncbi:MAG: purine nucleoside permease [Pseudomonadales bacterium]
MNTVETTRRHSSLKCGLLAALLLLALKPVAAFAAADEPAPIPIKVVVVSMFENGAITGDRPGEFQLWVERTPLDQEYAFELGEYPLRANKQGVLGICVGGGIPNATASIMALGLDSRFDLSNAYWLIAGIAGGDPEDVSLGTAVWAKHIVDGDLLYEIDAREIPEDWPYGIVPLGGKEPADAPEDISTGWTLDTVHFPLNAALADWAYDLTKGLATADTPALKSFRADFRTRPNARRAPFVTMGDTLSASTYWHGERLNGWANDWVKLYAGSDAEFMTSNMEDSGTLTALHRLDRIDRVDANRVMVLRTVSNYTMPPADKSAAWSTTAPYPDQGYPALDAAYRVGGKVVSELVAQWGQTRDTIPGRITATDR